MLSKESFLIAIKGIQQQRTFNEEMYTLLRKYDTQTNGFDCGCIILHTLMSILTAEMDDKHDYKRFSGCVSGAARGLYLIPRNCASTA